MGPRHRIDELLFETRLEGVEQQSVPWSDWPAVCRDRLLAVIARVFDEFSPDAETIHRLDHLEVRLAPFAGAASVEQIEARLAEALRLALQDSLRGPGGRAKSHPVPRATAELEALDCYLRQGMLPEGAEAPGFRLEERLLALATHHPRPIAQRLIADAFARERCLHQLSDSAVVRLLGLLSPAAGKPGFAGWLLQLQAEAAESAQQRLSIWRYACLTALPDAAPVGQSAGFAGRETTALPAPAAVPASPAVTAGLPPSNAHPPEPSPVSDAIPHAAGALGDAESPVAPALARHAVEPPHSPSAHRRGTDPEGQSRATSLEHPGEGATAGGPPSEAARHDSQGNPAHSTSLTALTRGDIGQAHPDTIPRGPDLVSGAMPLRPAVGATPAGPGAGSAAAPAGDRREWGSAPSTVASRRAGPGGASLWRRVPAADDLGASGGRGASPAFGVSPLSSWLQGRRLRQPQRQGQPLAAAGVGEASPPQPHRAQPEADTGVGSLAGRASMAGAARPGGEDALPGPHAAAPRSEAAPWAVDRQADDAGGAASPAPGLRQAIPLGPEGAGPDSAVWNPLTPAGMPEAPRPREAGAGIDPTPALGGPAPDSRPGLGAPAAEPAPPSEAPLREAVLARVSGAFAEAIERHAANARDRTGYYRSLLLALDEDEPIDPAALAAQSGEGRAGHSMPAGARLAAAPRLPDPQAASGRGASLLDGRASKPQASPGVAPGVDEADGETIPVGAEGTWPDFARDAVSPAHMPASAPSVVDRHAGDAGSAASPSPGGHPAISAGAEATGPGFPRDALTPAGVPEAPGRRDASAGADRTPALGGSAPDSRPDPGVPAAESALAAVYPHASRPQASPGAAPGIDQVDGETSGPPAGEPHRSADPLAPSAEGRSVARGAGPSRPAPAPSADRGPAIPVGLEAMENALTPARMPEAPGPRDAGAGIDPAPALGGRAPDSRPGSDVPAAEPAPPSEAPLREAVLARVSGAFAEAIERHAADAKDRIGYYRSLLLALDEDEPIDPAVLAAESGEGRAEHSMPADARLAATLRLSDPDAGSGLEASPPDAQASKPQASPGAALGIHEVDGEASGASAHERHRLADPLASSVEGRGVVRGAEPSRPELAPSALDRHADDAGGAASPASGQAPAIPLGAEGTRPDFARDALTPAGMPDAPRPRDAGAGIDPAPAPGEPAPDPRPGSDTPAAAPALLGEAPLREAVLARVSGAFAEAIERHAAEAADPGRYYRLLLLALDGDEPIDPAALAAASVPVDGPRGATAVGASISTDTPSTDAPSADPASPDTLERALAGDDAALEAAVLPLLADPLQVARLADAWADEALAGLFARLRPDHFTRLRPYAEVMSHVCPGAAPRLVRRLHWQFLARALFPAPRFGETAAFVVAYADFLSAALSAPGGGFCGTLCAALETAGKPLEARHIRFWLGDRPPPPAAPLVESAAGGIRVGNAGQVLVAAYLPRLFEMLGLLEKGRFVTDEPARRAVHLLQFMVDLRADAPEHELTLNKVLCGLALQQPVPASVDISARETALIDGMLRAVITHWGALGNTSVAGLREAFLQRPGVLRWKNDAWHLKVEKKTLDILMERLPWGFSIIRHPWMPQALMVEWI